MNLDFKVQVQPHVFPVVRIVANPKYNPEQAADDGAVSSQIKISPVEGKETHYFAELTVRTDPEQGAKNTPYAVHIMCVCNLEISDAVPAAERRSLITHTAHDLLFSSVRELVINITSRQPWGPISLGFSALSSEDCEAGGNAPNEVVAANQDLKKKRTRARRKVPQP